MGDLAAANKKAFDDLAANYDVHPWQITFSRIVTEGLQSHKEWLGARWVQDGDERPVKLLDYACGTGAASLALRTFVTQINGIDLSQGMITRYNETMARLGVSQQCHGVVGDLTDPGCTIAEARDQYDVAIISLALHHVEHADQVLKALATRLLPGGVLIVIDFLPFEHKHHHDDKHNMAHTIKQHGYTKAQMANLYSASGCSDFAFEVLPERASTGKDGKDFREIFIARGRVEDGVH